MRRILLVALAVLTLATNVHAQDNQSGGKPANGDKPQVFMTEHSGVFNGTRVDYTATAGETFLRDDDGDPTASIFSISYVADDIDEPSSRPVTFLFNGGPGSASVWLHMGAFGPRRVAVPSDARDDAGPPYSIVDNPMALLDVTDLVFIDPVGTGYSHALGETENKEFYGIHEDARSVADFIRRWITENGRWNSPKYLGGESYGTTRTAAVVRELEGAFNDVALNGLLLVSTILDFSSRAEDPGNEMTYVLYLPTMAATAWYHGKVDGEPDLDSFVRDAREFALNDYANALLKGQALSDDRRAEIRRRLAHFTGLSETFLENANLRVAYPRFQKELLRDEGLVVGRLDSRYTGRDYDNAGERPDSDPSFYGIDAAYTAAVNHYLTTELGVDLDRQYNVISGLGRDWNWETQSRGSPFYINLTPYVGRAMRENSGLRVLLMSGYYDFATPFFGAEYSLMRNGVVPERIVKRYYEAGHMMYVHEPSLETLLDDVRGFITAE